MPGRFRGYEKRDYKAFPSFCEYPEWSSGYLPRSEWKERIDYLNSIKSQPVHWHKKRCKIKNQLASNYCWSFGTVSAVETAYAMSGIEGLELNAHAVAYRGKKGRNRGGFGLECCKLIQEAGIPCLWSRHDELILEIADTQEARNEAKAVADRIMTTPHKCEPNTPLPI